MNEYIVVYNNNDFVGREIAYRIAVLYPDFREAFDNAAAFYTDDPFEVFANILLDIMGERSFLVCQTDDGGVWANGI